MGFLSNLGKGFISSAVNQVGRDYGRTFSNKIFGDRHYTPIKHIGGGNGSSYDSDTIEKESSLPAELGIKKYSELGYTIFKHKTTGSFGYTKFDYFLIVLLCFMTLIPIIGAIIVVWFLVKGFSIMVKKNDDFSHMCAAKYGPVTERIPDKRFSSGYREETSEKLEIIHFAPEPKDIRNSKIKKVILGFVHMFFPAILFLVVGWTVYLVDKQFAPKPTGTMKDSILICERTDEVIIYEGKTPLRKETKTLKDVKVLFKDDKLTLQCPYSANKPYMKMSFTEEIYNKENKKMSKEHIYYFNKQRNNDSIYAYELKYETLPSQCLDFLDNIEIVYQLNKEDINNHRMQASSFTIKEMFPWTIMTKQLVTRVSD